MIFNLRAYQSSNAFSIIVKTEISTPIGYFSVCIWTAKKDV